jgi:hypothetical protein
MKGMSMWIFSRVVMLIFLFMTFAAVISFMRVVNERSTADAGKIMTMQISDALQGVLGSRVLSSQVIIPLPTVLPETGILKPSESAGFSRTYTLTIITSAGPSNGSVLLSTGLAWGKHVPGEDVTYTTASSIVTDEGFRLNSVYATNVPRPSIMISSEDASFMIINKVWNEAERKYDICVFGCKKLDEPINCTYPVPECELQ